MNGFKSKMAFKTLFATEELTNHVLSSDPNNTRDAIEWNSVIIR